MAQGMVPVHLFNCICLASICTECIQSIQSIHVYVVYVHGECLLFLTSIPRTLRSRYPNNTKSRSNIESWNSLNTKWNHLLERIALDVISEKSLD
jgi:hypothetical protein